MSSDPSAPAASQALVDASSLGVAVRAARLASGQSLRSVAAQLQVSPATLSLLETGKAKFTIERLLAVSRVVGVDLADLLSRARVEQAPVEQEAPAEKALDAPSETSQSNDVGTATDWREFPPLRISNVLAAALRCFAARGYVGASIRDIAHEAGLSVPGVYYHYSSKEDMLAAIITEASNEARWRVEAAHSEANDPVGRFSLMIEAMCMFYLRRRDLASVAITEMRHLNPDRYRRIAPIRWTVQTKIDGEIATAAAAGLFRTSNPEEAGRAVIMLSSALAHRYSALAEPDVASVARLYRNFALALVEYVPSD